MPKYFNLRAWLIGLGVSALLTLAAIRYVDIPVARFVDGLPWSDALHAPGLGLPILIALSGLVVLAGAIWQAADVSLRKLMESLIIASFALAWSLCIVELLLKPYFGRETTNEFIRSGKDAFQWFRGQPWTSFPSGHATQIVSVGTVLLLSYPTQKPFWFVAMGLGLAALVLGNWHFVSDVIAGSACGAIGGAATMRVWHSWHSR